MGGHAAEAIPILIERLESPNRAVREHAVWALGRMGMKARVAIPRLMTVNREADTDLRIDIVNAAADLGGTAGTRIVATALTDDDPRVRSVAASLLRGNEGKAFIPQILSLLGDKDAEVRRAAIDTLGDHGAAAVDALPSLKRIFEDDGEDIFIRREAFRSARHIERSKQ